MENDDDDSSCSSSGPEPDDLAKDPELKEAFLDKIPNEWGFTIHTLANFRSTPDNLGVIYGVKNHG